MNQLKHTHGPWSLGRIQNSGDPICGIFEVLIHHGEKPTQGNVVAEAYTATAGGKENAEANARLIAAAPDLLKAAAVAMRLCVSEGLAGSEESQVIREAIQKAIGSTACSDVNSAVLSLLNNQHAT